MALLPIVASRETKLLAQELGNEFLKYQEQVHAFLPLRKFKGWTLRLAENRTKEKELLPLYEEWLKIADDRSKRSIQSAIEVLQ